MIDEDQPQREAANRSSRIRARCRQPAGSRAPAQPAPARRRAPPHPLRRQGGCPAIRSATDVIWHRLDRSAWRACTTPRSVSARSLQADYKGSRRHRRYRSELCLKPTIENSASWAMPARRLVPPEPFASILLFDMIPHDFRKSAACTAPVTRPDRSHRRTNFSGTVVGRKT